MRIQVPFEALRAALLVAALALSGCLSLRSSDTAVLRPLTERERAVHLLNRATYGVRPQDVDEVLRVGVRDWLLRQLAPEEIEPLSDADPTLYQLGDVSLEQPDSTGATALDLLEGPLRVSLNALLANRLLNAIASERQLEQVMTDFWFNHFNVSSSKPPVGRWLSDYEQTIRAHVFGRFEDMLIATAQHPAMLVYLDQHLSAAFAPYMRAATGVASAPDRGEINENYARELLELHTVGVDAGYTQRDVVDVARALSGWTLSGAPAPIAAYEAVFIARPMKNPRLLTARVREQLFSRVPRQQLEFKFEQYWHDGGAKNVMGLSLPPGGGVEDGLELLDFLARHPSTARHVASKLVRHFVADDPPAALVDELAGVFLATDGDLREVTLALFTSEAFYAPRHYRAKIKRPYEFVVSAVRAADGELGRASTLFLGEELGRMRHRPYTELAPTGFPTQADQWVSEGAMVQRMNFALGLSQDFADRRSDYRTVFDLLEMPDAELHVDPFALIRIEDRPDNVSTQVLAGRVLERVFAGTVVLELERFIADDLARVPQPAARETLIRRALALALASPEFQRY